MQDFKASILNSIDMLLKLNRIILIPDENSILKHARTRFTRLNLGNDELTRDLLVHLDEFLISYVTMHKGYAFS